jgi:hypothetical protein
MKFAIRHKKKEAKLKMTRMVILVSYTQSKKGKKRGKLELCVVLSQRISNFNRLVFWFLIKFKMRKFTYITSYNEMRTRKTFNKV